MRGYHVRYLKDPQTQIGHATIFIRPLQRNLSLEPICQPECSSELNGPPQNVSHVEKNSLFHKSRVKNAQGKYASPSDASGTCAYSSNP
ncbi:hypothetical protein SRHO_G00009780 [Serrasalmus rhombeus]